MNITYYFYCEREHCLYRTPVHEMAGEITMQCGRCLRIESKEKKQTYALQCLACGKTEQLGESASFDGKTCVGCGLGGKVGQTAEEGALFLLLSDSSGFNPCSNCKRNEWEMREDEHFTCPHCFGELKQKLSQYWEG